VAQPFGTPKPVNVITGKFSDPGHTDWAGAPATKVSRQGIEDAFVGKASSVWYWNGARWLRLAAAD
jgi:hypothetical protein